MQFAPTDQTKISIDGLYSKFKETREEQWLEVLARSNERSIDLVNPVYDANNNIVSAISSCRRARAASSSSVSRGA